MVTSEEFQKMQNLADQGEHTKLSLYLCRLARKYGYVIAPPTASIPCPGISKRARTSEETKAKILAKFK